MRAIKHKRPKWRKPPSPAMVRAATTMIEGGGYYGCRAGDRLTMTTHNGERVVEVVEVCDGRVRVREVIE